LHRLVFLDPEIIDNLKAVAPADPDPEVAEAVRQALLNVSPELRRLIRERYFEGLTIGEISERNHLAERETVRRIYEAKRQLKMVLAGFVKKRWGIEVKGLCRICTHAEREKIEAVLRTRKKTESWGSTCRKVQDLLKERIQPPQVLKAHMKHMK
jgi:hypothetical protein